MSQKIQYLDNGNDVRPCLAVLTSDPIDMTAVANTDVVIPNNALLILKSLKLLTKSAVAVTGGATLAVQAFDPALTPNNVAAALTTAGAANSNLTFTAVVPGVGGNSITITYAVAGNNTVLAVGVVGNAITVTVATGGGGAATSTGAQVLAAILATPAAVALVSAALAAANSGVGVVAAIGATNLTGGTSADIVATIVSSVTISASDAVNKVQALTLNGTQVALYGGMRLRLVITAGATGTGGLALTHALTGDFQAQ